MKKPDPAHVPNLPERAGNGRRNFPSLLVEMMKCREREKQREENGCNKINNKIKLG